jgi:hypothetical protein
MFGSTGGSCSDTLIPCEGKCSEPAVSSVCVSLKQLEKDAVCLTKDTFSTVAFTMPFDAVGEAVA